MELQGSERFGQHLRRLRERRRLSLDNVEELSTDHLERITRSHLSRIENGQALPTLTRLMTLSRLYGEKLAELVERLEFDIQVESSVPIDVTNRSAEELEAEAKIEAERGDLVRAFHLYEAAADRLALSGEEPAAQERSIRIRLKLSSVLQRAGRYGLAIEYAESTLSHPGISPATRVWALTSLAAMNYHLGRYALCRVLLDGILAFGDAVPAYHLADAKMLQGALLFVEGDLAAACDAYSEALTRYRELDRPFEESRALRGLSKSHLARKQTKHALRFIDMQIALSRQHGLQLEHGWGLKLKAMIMLEQGDVGLASSLLRQSNEIARRVDQPDLLFANHYLQWRLATQDDDVGLANSLVRILRRLRGRAEEDSPERRGFDAEFGEGAP